MAKCPFCQLHEFVLGDRFCGLCGKTLCQLVFDDGLYIELTEDAKGTIEHETVARNQGRSPLTIRINDTIDSAVRVSSSEQHVVSLDPFSEDGTPIKFLIDSGKLLKRKLQYCSVEFECPDDPRMLKGTIRFGIPTPGEVTIKTDQTIELPELITSDSDSGVRYKEHFVVRVTNHGGQIVTATLEQARDEFETYPIQVAFQDGDSFQIDGYSENVSIPFVAWTNVEREDVNDSFMIIFRSKDSDSDAIIKIKSPRCVGPPKIEVKTLEFTELVPGRAFNFSCGQTRIASMEVHNTGGSPFTITKVSSDSNLIRVLPKQLPMEVKPLKEGDTAPKLEFVMSTRVNGQHISEDTKLPVGIRLLTDSPHIGEYFVKGQAQFRVPKQKRGLMAVDFGTMNSCVAYFDEALREPEVVEDDQTSESFVPSMMIFVEQLHRYEDWLLHGPDISGIRPFMHSGGVIHSVKRAIERDRWQVYDREYSGTQLATWIIEQLLLETGRRHNCRPEQVAMTIPAGFWGPRRKAMVKACEEACRLAWGDEGIIPTIIDEPTAAAMYFYFRNRSLVISEIKKEKPVFRVFVFDFGGGTLDISVVEFIKDERGILNVRLKIARGDNLMGGIDLDLQVVRALAKRAKKKCPNITEAALTSSRWRFITKFGKRTGFKPLQANRVQLYQAAKELKERLTDEIDVEFSFTPFFNADGNEVLKGNGKLFEFKDKITKEIFEKMIRQRVRRATNLVKTTLNSVSLKTKDIDTVLLTGQSSIIPCFQQAVRGLFSDLKSELQDPDMPLKSSVAAGAAWAAMENAHGRIKLHRLNRTSYRYGIEGTWVSGQSPPFVELIPMSSVFGESKKTITLQLEDREHGFREMYIIQNGKKQNNLVLDGKDPDVTIIGKIDLTDYPPGEKTFSLFFSTDTGMLRAELDDCEIKIEAVYDQTSETIYL